MSLSTHIGYEEVTRGRNGVLQKYTALFHYVQVLTHYLRVFRMQTIKGRAVNSELADINTRLSDTHITMLSVVENSDKNIEVGVYFDDRVLLAIDECKVCVLHQLLRTGININARDSVTCGGYLHRVIIKTDPGRQKDWIPFVYAFSNAGIDLETTDNDGNTALHLSIRHSLLEMMVACLKVGSIASSVQEQLIFKHTGFFSFEYHNWYQKLVPGVWEAVSNDNTFRVNKLLKSWCRVNVQRNGESLIEYAKRIGSKAEIINLLVKNEASVEMAHATIAGDEIRMKTLLCDNSVRLDTKDCSNRDDIFSPLCPMTLKEAAVKYNHPHLLYLLGAPNYLHNAKAIKSSSICAIL